MAPAFEFVITAGQGTGAPYPFPSAHFVLGSAPSAELRFPSNLVRPRHVELELDPMGVVWVRDLTGEQLMAIDGEVLERGALEPGSRLRLGPLELELGVLGAPRHAVGQTTGGVAPAPNPAVTATNLTGMVVDGRYEVISKLASGGMGDVYRARHVELGKLMVLKVMRPHLSDDPDIVARFKREAVSASRIGHQNIVDISDFGRTDEGRFYFVMEFLDGPTLADVMRRERVLHVSRAVNVGVQIARALGAAHALGIVHRDLKPENVILLKRGTEGDFVKVVDFGVAKVSDGRGQGGQTAFGVVVGTPQYMSPEQAAGMPVDARSDIYSLGLIVYELIAGRVVFEGETPSMVMAAHINQPAPALEPGLADSFVPDDLRDLVMRMLEKKREGRPQTMAEVIEGFEAFLSTTARVTPATSPRATDVARASAGVVTKPSRPAAATPQRASAVVQQPPPQLAPEPIPEATVPGKSKLPFLIAGVVGLAVVGGGVFFSASGHTPAEPTPPPVKPPVAIVELVTPTEPPRPAEPAKVPVEPAKPEQVTLRVTSEPDKAEVDEEDGTIVGTTPFPWTVEKGKKLTFIVKKDGYQPEKKAVNPSADLELHVKLTPVAKTQVAQPRGPKIIEKNPFEE